MNVGGPTWSRGGPGAGSDVTSKSRLRSYSSRFRRATDTSWAERAARQRRPPVEPAGGGQARRVRRKHLVLDQRREKDRQPVEARLDVDRATGKVKAQDAAVLGPPAGIQVID